MTPCRLLVTGASGSGTTTLGRALATDWAVPHADVDDYFWLPTSPAYVDKRPVDDRLRLMAEVFLGATRASSPVPSWAGVTRSHPGSTPSCS